VVQDEASQATRRDVAKGAFYGLASAGLFGLTAPTAKLLLPGTPPVQLAALLYLGAGVGLTLVAALPPVTRSRSAKDRLRRSDVPLLLAIVVSGGILGPTLMLTGLRKVSGVAGALLLNLETVFTTLLAVTVFGDTLNRREAGAAVAVVCGAGLLAYDPSGSWATSPLGASLVAGACLAWGLDNNLTQRLSVRDPIRIVQVKALSAGTVNLALSLGFGYSMRWSVVPASVAVGFFGYGVSIVFDVLALRYLGAAREAVFFAAAPFVGAVAAIPILGESFGIREGVAGAVMLAGLWGMMSGRKAT
jgi:drug/metabolite transporter (DMT)-like permease